MVERIEEIIEFARNIAILEKEFNVKIVSDNGHTDACIVDLVTQIDYSYNKGEVIGNY